MPSKKGLCLSLEDYQVFKELIPEIDAELDAMMKQPDQ